VDQMRINQRISQAAVRRVNGIAAELAGRRRSAERTAQVAAATPRAITLSAAQLRINQRISQAALRRVNALLATLPAPA
jgi:stage II sporulation protein D